MIEPDGAAEYELYHADLRQARAEGYAAGYEAGQREMRETAAKHLERCRRKEAFLVDIAIGIRALPINPPPAET